MTQLLQHPIRLLDIAKKAGVSQITVSKVLHNRGGKNTRVSEGTAERIRKIAAELKYRPNLAARQLAGERSYLIGGILDPFANETYTKRLITMERLAASRGYRLLVGYSHGEVDRIIGHINDFFSRGVDGVVCLAHTYPEYGQQIAQSLTTFKNCVMIERPLGNVPLPYVQPDYVEVGRMITRHLLDRGRRRIAILQFGWEYRTVQDEMLGYQAALQEAGISFDPSLILKPNELDDINDVLINRYMEPLLAVRPDAVITPNDGIAMWVIKVLAARGLRVPADLAVVSVDAWEIGRSYIPAITAVDLRAQEVGVAAIEMLLEDIENPQTERRIRTKIIQPQLTVGESCGMQ